MVMHHVAGPGDVHWYWVVYGLSTRVNHLDEASSAVGTNGTNSVNGRNEYTPPCSKGPGPKAYTLTVYALSAVPTFPPASAVSRDVLLAAIAHTTLASSSLTVMYSRQSTAADAPPPRPRRGGAAPDTTVPRN